MFRASSARLQEDTVVHVLHMVLSLSMRVLGGLSVHRFIESSHSSCVPTGHQELSQRVTVPYAACVQLYPPEDEHLRVETCRGEYYFMNK